MSPVVAVFDVDLPPGVAFIRSLGRAGVPVVGDVLAAAPQAGRYSRFHDELRCVPAAEAHRRVRRVAEPTSSSVDRSTSSRRRPTTSASASAEALEELGRDASRRRASRPRRPPHSPVQGPLRRRRWSTSASRRRRGRHPTIARRGAGGSATRSATRWCSSRAPTPASERSAVPWSAPPTSSPSSSSPIASPKATPPSLRHDPTSPSRSCSATTTSGPSTWSACPAASTGRRCRPRPGHCRKVSQSPRRLGVGTMFEPIPDQPFAEPPSRRSARCWGPASSSSRSSSTARTGEYWAIDLNPRGFGQMSLDIALGDDLPALWYESVTGDDVADRPRPRAPGPSYWHDAVVVLRRVRRPLRAWSAPRGHRRPRAPAGCGPRASGRCSTERDPAAGRRLRAAALPPPASVHPTASASTSRCPVHRRRRRPRHPRPGRRARLDLPR